MLKSGWLCSDYGFPETDLKRAGLFGGTQNCEMRNVRARSLIRAIV